MGLFDKAKCQLIALLWPKRNSNKAIKSSGQLIGVTINKPGHRYPILEMPSHSRQLMESVIGDDCDPMPKSTRIGQNTSEMRKIASKNRARDGSGVESRTAPTALPAVR